MPPTPYLVDAAVTTTNPYPPAGEHHFFTFNQTASGFVVRICIYTNGTNTYYALLKWNSTLSDYQWGTPVQIVAGNVFTGGAACCLVKGSPSGGAYAVTDNGYLTDVIYLFYTVGTNLHQIALTYAAPSTVTISTASALALDLGVGGAGVTGFNFIDGVWDNTALCWHISVCYSTSASPSAQMLAIRDVLSGGPPPVSLTNTQLPNGRYGVNFGGTTWTGLHVVQSAHTPAVVYLAVGSIMHAAILLTAYTVNSGGGGFTSYTRGSNYEYATGEGTVAPLKFSVFAEPVTGNLDFAWYQPPPGAGVGLYAIKRTGTNIYGGLILLTANPTNSDGSLDDNITPSFIHDANSGDIYVAYMCALNEPDGEIWLAKRPAGGSWQAATVIAGGDTMGYQAPSVMQEFNSAVVTGQAIGANVLFNVGTTSPYSLESVEFTPTQAPNTPVIVSPNGPIIGNTPTLSWQYNNVNPLDTQSGYSLVVTNEATLTAAWTDSNAAYTADTLAWGASALSYGQTYLLQLSLTETLGGQVSPQAQALFTPYHQPTIAIGDVSNHIFIGPSSSNGTISAGGTAHVPIINVPFKPTSTEGLDVFAYQIDLLDTDQASIKASTGIISQAIASGSYYTAPDFDFYTDGVQGPLPINSSTYYARVTCWFNATGGYLSAKSSTFSLVPSITVPGPVTSLTVTPTPEGGCYNTIAWTNSGAAVSINTFYRLHAGPGPWIELTSGTLPTSIQHFAPINVAIDYGVQVVDQYGTVGAITTATNTTLTGPFGGSRSFVLNDVTDLLNKTVALGLIDSNDFETTTLRQAIKNSTIVMSPGRTLPTIEYSQSRYYSYQTTKWTVPMTDTYGTTTVLGTTVVNALDAMDASSNPLLVRDPFGNMGVYKMEKSQFNAMDGNTWLEVYFDINQVSYPRTDFVI